MKKTLNEQALIHDKNDQLASVVDDFILPENTIYLDGNSLGPLHKLAQLRATEVVEKQWGQDLITSWNKHAWIDLARCAGEKIAPLVGAAPGQVICCDSISVNLFKLLSCALYLQNTLFSQTQRRFVLSQEDNFPTDLYMVQGLQSLVGVDKCELIMAPESDIYRIIEEQGQEISVLMLTHVNFRSGNIHDMKRLTSLAHQQGMLVIWDLAHSAGVLPVLLDECEVDFAVGCGYKYLNGGPGAPAFIYANVKHHVHLQQPLSGWMGHVTPFSFKSEYTAKKGVEQFLCGTPNIISLSVLDAALDVFENLTITQVRHKSIGLGKFFQECLAAHNLDAHFSFASPIEAGVRGSQVALAHEHAYAICQALIEAGVIADFRAPNILRLGFSPLFLRYRDIYASVSSLDEIMISRSYLEPCYSQKQAVT